MEHNVHRVRHELKRRRLTVTDKTRITPGMLRIEFSCDDFADFASVGADDHVKIFVADPSGEPARRDYTPRRFDRATGALTLDFAVHEAGPATRWALECKPGDALDIGGPRGSLVIPWTFDWLLLVGDETALPAIGRRIEEAPAGQRIVAVATIASPDERQVFATAADLTMLWVYRPLSRADDPGPTLEALGKLEWPGGDGFVWIASEAKVAGAARDYLWETRGHPRLWTKAAGYWVKGEADAHAKLED